MSEMLVICGYEEWTARGVSFPYGRGCDSEHGLLIVSALPNSEVVLEPGP